MTEFDFVIDLESNGFRALGQEIHCLEAIHIQTGTQFHFANQPGYRPISAGIELCLMADHLIGHNLLGFDIPVIERCWGVTIPRDKVWDTLPQGRILMPDLQEQDAVAGMPALLVGKHSLDAWGRRLGVRKDDYAHYQGQPWSLALQRHCETDTIAPWALYEHLREADSQDAPFFAGQPYQLERTLIGITNRITAMGFPVNRRKGQALLADLEQQSAEFAEELQRMLPPVTVEEVFIPKRNNKTKNYLAGIPFVKRKSQAFNPNSGRQFADRMIERHGWQPRETADGGDPKVTAAVLATLDYPEAKTLLRHKIAAKRIGMLIGDNGYLTLLDADGRLRTQYSPLGAVTGRCTHKPNVAQVPGVSKDKDGSVLYGADGGWGFEFRDAFEPPPGWFLVGADQAGLELRLLSHYLFDFDDGEYVTIVCEGDAHETNRVAAGLDSRSVAKRLIYATVYGCGDYKAGTIVEPDENDEFTLKWVGKLVKASLIDGIKGFRELFSGLNGINGTTLPGLDGRPLYSRKVYSRLNTLIQAAGSILCKRWIVMIDAELQRLGLRPGEDGDFEFVAWIHDEVQIAARTREIAEIVAQTCVTMAQQAGRFYDLHCPTDGTAKIGASWALTH